MSKILCLLPICCFPTNKYTFIGNERIQQYIAGLNKFFEYIQIMNNHNIDIYIFDNTIDKNDTLPKELLEIIPDNVKVINDNANKYGGINKGAGLIESWLYLKDIIEQYDYLIHFEPRQLLVTFDFIQSFLQNKSNVFTLGGDNKHFNTGLFCIECKVLLKFIVDVDIIYMMRNVISIEYMVFNFFNENNIPYIIMDKMNLIWYPYLEKTAVSW
jgi:hypothetical protein